MLIRMTVSLMEMPGMVLREEGRTYDIADEVAAAWLARGLAGLVGGSEVAAVEPRAETADVRPAATARRAR